MTGRRTAQTSVFRSRARERMRAACACIGFRRTHRRKTGSRLGTRCRHYIVKRPEHTEPHKWLVRRRVRASDDNVHRVSQARQMAADVHACAGTWAGVFGAGFQGLGAWVGRALGVRDDKKKILLRVGVTQPGYPPTPPPPRVSGEVFD